MNGNTATEGEENREESNDWHPLPQLIGNAMVGNVETIMACGKWAVETEDGDVIVYLVVEESPDDADLPPDCEIRQLWDAYVALEEHVRIEEPAFGWDSETEPVRKSIWDGYR